MEAADGDPVGVGVRGTGSRSVPLALRARDNALQLPRRTGGDAVQDRDPNPETLVKSAELLAHAVVEAGRQRATRDDANLNFALRFLHDLKLPNLTDVSSFGRYSCAGIEHCRQNDER